MLLMLAFGLIVVLLPITFAIFMDGFRSKLAEQMNYASIENYLTFGLLALVASMFIRGDSKHGIYFSPAEIENLFCTPLSRRQLLAYRLFVELRSAFLMGVTSGCGLIILLPNAFCGLMGFGLVLVFAKLLPIFFAIIGETAHAHAYNRRRKWIGCFLLSSIAILVLWQLGQNQFQFEWTRESIDRLLANISNSFMGIIVLFLSLIHI